MNKTLQKRTFVVLSLLCVFMSFGFSQNGFEAKDLSSSPTISGNSDVESLGFIRELSSTPPTITVADGKMLVQCASGQTMRIRATDATAYQFKPTGDYTIEFRLAVPNNNGRGLDLSLQDGAFSYSLINVSHEKLFGFNLSRTWYSLDSKRYHTYRLGVKRQIGEVHAWVDGIYKGVIQKSTDPRNTYLFEFGKGSVAPITELDIEYVTFDFSGAYKPVNVVLEEPAYEKKDMSISPNLDGNQHPVSQAGWSAVTNTGSLTVADGIITIESPNNTQYTIEAPSFTITDKFSIEFRAMVESTTGRGMDIVIGQELYCLTDKKLYKYADLLPLCEFTETKYRTFRFAGSKEGKYIDAWVDSEYVGSFSSKTDGLKFQIGKNQSAASTKLMIDYVTLSTEGEYMPLGVGTKIDNALSVDNNDNQAYIVVGMPGAVKIEMLHNDVLVDIFDISGRKVYTNTLTKGIHTINLKKGIYIVGKQKVVVR